MINKFLTLSLVSAMSLAAAASANAASVVNPTYMPGAGEGYLKASTTFRSISDDTVTNADDGIDNVNLNEFEAGFGFGSGLSFHFGTTPIRGSSSYSLSAMSAVGSKYAGGVQDDPYQTTVGLNYRILDDANKLDLYLDWDVQFADQDSSFDSNRVNLGIKFGQDLASIAYNVGFELNYNMSSDIKSGAGKLEKDASLDYGLNGEVMFKINDKFSTNLNLALLMYSDIDYDDKDPSDPAKYTQELDLSYRFGVAFNYQLRENVALTGKISYEEFAKGALKAKDGGKVDVDGLTELGVGFGVAVAF